MYFSISVSVFSDLPSASVSSENQTGIYQNRSDSSQYYLLQGTSARFFCNTSGQGPFSVRWYNVTSQQRELVSTYRSLHLQNGISGAYECEVTAVAITTSRRSSTAAITVDILRKKLEVFNELEESVSEMTVCRLSMSLILQLSCRSTFFFVHPFLTL